MKWATDQKEEPGRMEIFSSSPSRGARRRKRTHDALLDQLVDQSLIEDSAVPWTFDSNDDKFFQAQQSDANYTVTIVFFTCWGVRMCLFSCLRDIFRDRTFYAKIEKTPFWSSILFICNWIRRSPENTTKWLCCIRAPFEQAGSFALI